MDFVTIKIIIFSLIIIFIIHFSIKHLLLREQIYKKIKNKKITTLDLPDIQESFVQDDCSCNNFEIEPDSNECNANENNDENNMEQQLLNYMQNNADIYKVNVDTKNDINLNTITKGNNEKSNLEKYYQPVVDITKEITIPNDKKPKKKNIKEPTFSLNSKEPVNEYKDTEVLWEYSDENIMNGGAINNDLYGWDSTTNSQYATLNAHPTILN
jgi:hypothetical protein